MVLVRCRACEEMINPMLRHVCGRPVDTSATAIAEKLEQIKRLNRQRQKRYRERKKAKE